VHRLGALFQEIELISASLWTQSAESLMLIHCWTTRAWHENTKSGKSALEASRTATLSLMQVTPPMGLRRWVHHEHRATKILPRREYRFREQWRSYLRVQKNSLASNLEPGLVSYLLNQTKSKEFMATSYCIKSKYWCDNERQYSCCKGSECRSILV